MKNLILLFFLFVFTLPFYAQTEEYIINDTLAGNINFFSNEEPLNFTLISDFKKFRKEKYKGKYQPATLIYQINDTLQLEKELRIKARGEFRRKQCNFPPIRINWRKTEIVKNEFADYYKMKMVTHCGKGEMYQQYVFKEYLCYKMYNLLTDTSFRVRLAKIKYVDTGNKKLKETNTFAFFIEDADMMAERLNTIQLKLDNLDLKDIEPENRMLVSFFLFMIGNSDWSIPGRHNVKILKSKDFTKSKAYAVPYDFDFSGIVNTVYAIADEERLGIKDVKERVYLGVCAKKADFQPIIKRFNQHKDDFYHLIENFEYLNDSNKKEMLNYLNQFYNLMNKESFYSFYLTTHCKKYDN